MSQHSRTAAAAAAELSQALHRIGDALVNVDADELLAAEVDLGRAMASVAAVSDAGDRSLALDAVRQAQSALLRCRRLGASLSKTSGALLRAGHSTPGGYTRWGSYLDRVFAHSSLQTRA